VRSNLDFVECILEANHMISRLLANLPALARDAKAAKRAAKTLKEVRKTVRELQEEADRLNAEAEALKGAARQEDLTVWELEKIRRERRAPGPTPN
jgi:hypothetical protein